MVASSDARSWSDLDVKFGYVCTPCIDTRRSDRLARLDSDNCIAR